MIGPTPPLAHFFRAVFWVKMNVCKKDRSLLRKDVLFLSSFVCFSYFSYFNVLPVLSSLCESIQNHGNHHGAGKDFAEIK